MNKTEKGILQQLKAGVSQSQIARDFGVPRSIVQRVSDKELGVDPKSLKSLTNEQIIEIQKLAASTTNKFLANQFGVSDKTIARALLVKISEHDNNVTVISPVEGLDEGGEFDITTDINPGGVAKYIGSNKELSDCTVYIGAYLEDRNSYMIASQLSSANIALALVKRADLEALETGLSVENLSSMAILTDRVINSGAYRDDNHEINVEVDGETGQFQLKGKLNSKGQIGYLDPILNMTVRVALSRCKFTVNEYNEVVEEAKEGESTARKLKGTDLDKFLKEHQILILDNQVVITQNGKALTIGSEHEAYNAIVEAIKVGDIKRAYELMEPRKAISKFTQGRLLLDGKKVSWQGYDITGLSMAKRFMEVAMKGDYSMVERFAKFLDKVFDNPSAVLVKSGRIFEFMQYQDIEVDEDGDIIVYKVVRSNYMDKHSGTISNKPGTIVRMARSFVDDNMASLCSYGLHVCAPAYIRKLFGNSGDRVLRCKLNPKDIVSVTNDYNSSKIRCCEYLVLEDYTQKYNQKFKSIDMVGFYK